MDYANSHLNHWFKGNTATVSAEGALSLIVIAMAANATLRKQLRHLRCQLNGQQQRHAAEQTAAQVAASRAFLNSQSIAAYLPVNGELDPTPLIQRAWSLGKKIYLPILAPSYSGKLWFMRYTPNTRLINNRFCIPEPASDQRQRIPAQALDLVLTPLVGFDKQGNRLGMGGGFYDRTFAFLNHRRYFIKPHLLGLAYEIQAVTQLKREPWDIPLHSVATEKNYHRFA